NGVGEAREAIREVGAAAAPDQDALAPLPGEDAEAVVFYFMQPAGSGRRIGDERRFARADEDTMGVGSRGPGIPGGVTNPTQERPMSEMFNPHASATAYDHNTTIVAVLELSGKNWLLGVVAPGLSVRMKRSFEARNVEAVVRAL